jgi:hypothetical protein
MSAPDGFHMKLQDRQLLVVGLAPLMVAKAAVAVAEVAEAGDPATAAMSSPRSLGCCKDGRSVLLMTQSSQLK